jgi:hypothetical protein
MMRPSMRRYLPGGLGLLATALVAATLPAQARTLRLDGKSGYLSEWEVKAEVTANRDARGREEFSGPLTLRHVGVCSPNGAVEKSGTIKLHISKSVWAPSQIHATLSIDGAQCTYIAKLSGDSSGFMECAGGASVPLTLSLQ